MEQHTNRYWSTVAAGLTPYVPGEQPRDRSYIKLNTNESPFAPAPGVAEAIHKEAGEALRLYPDPDSTALVNALAALHGVDPAQVFVGNGSDEVLAFAFQAFYSGKALRSADITYSFYPVYAQLYDVAYETVPVSADFAIDANNLCGPCGVVLANPNAPTSRAMPLAEIRRIAAHCQQNGQVLLVDEAYVAFGGESALPLLTAFDNVLVVRTFSKAHALAGLRVGYAVGHSSLIEALNRVKNCFNSYTLDRLAQVAAVAAVEDVAYFDRCVAAVCATRERVTEALTGMGCQVLPSAANFVFVRHPDHTGHALQAGLRDRGILVRRFASVPRIADWLRITIGSDRDMDAVLTAMAALTVG